jgi:hypothetical protein
MNGEYGECNRSWLTIANKKNTEVSGVITHHVTMSNLSTNNSEHTITCLLIKYWCTFVYSVTDTYSSTNVDMLYLSFHCNEGLSILARTSDSL